MKVLPTLDRLTPAPLTCPACGAGRNLLESGDCRLKYRCGAVYELMTYNESDAQQWSGVCPVEQPGDAQPTDADLKRIEEDTERLGGEERRQDAADERTKPDADEEFHHGDDFEAQRREAATDERVKPGADERRRQPITPKIVKPMDAGSDDDRADFVVCWNFMAQAAEVLKRMMERRSMDGPSKNPQMIAKG